MSLYIFICVLCTQQGSEITRLKWFYTMLKKFHVEKIRFKVLRFKNLNLKNKRVTA